MMLRASFVFAGNGRTGVIFRRLNPGTNPFCQTLFTPYTTLHHTRAPYESKS